MIIRTLICAATVAFAAGAQQPAPQALPKAETILDRYVEVTGGRAAYEKVRSEVRTSTIDIPAQGIKMTATSYRVPPNKSYMLVEIPGVGKMEEGTNGEVVWSLSAMRGPAIKEGAEREFGLLTAAFNSDLRWRELFKTAETEALEDVEGQPCYKVALVSNGAVKMTRFYSKESGLLVKALMTVKTEMGEIPTESVVSDYRAVDGVLIPYKASTKMLTLQLNTTVESAKNNVEIEASRFDLPADIRALLAKKP